jgi:hypothetical protein
MTKGKKMQPLTTRGGDRYAYMLKNVTPEDVLHIFMT